MAEENNEPVPPEAAWDIQAALGNDHPINDFDVERIHHQVAEQVNEVMVQRDAEARERAGLILRMNGHQGLGDRPVSRVVEFDRSRAHDLRTETQRAREQALEDERERRQFMEEAGRRQVQRWERDQATRNGRQYGSGRNKRNRFEDWENRGGGSP